MVRVVDHDPSWFALFETEKARILEQVGAAALDVQHVGSTSIPSLPAKPIIDIALAIASLEEADRILEALSALDYEHKPEVVIPGELFFRKRDGAYHLHVLQPDSIHWQEYMVFRDYLRAHPEIAQQYVQLKLLLASQFAEDRKSYTCGKAEFIRRVLKDAVQRDLTPIGETLDYD
jgi:GrpB-like predicted nucleotidyltransferase (UPF0157 family)